MRQDRRPGRSRAFASVFSRYRPLTVALLVAGALAGLTSIAVPGLISSALGYGYQYGGCFDGYTYQYGTCEPPHLIVIKHVVETNGGTAGASDFTMTIHNKGDQSFPGAESPGTLAQLAVGDYYVTEAGPSGYTASFSAACSGSINVDETKTCTVTNHDNPAILIVIKHVINDSGRSAKAKKFLMTINGITATGGNSFKGAEAPGTSRVVIPGGYTVTESSSLGYASSFSAGCSGTIASGETKICTVTNDDYSLRFPSGFWTGHQTTTTALLPQSLGNHSVATFAEAAAILNKKACKNGVVNCLARQLLTTELNLANGTNPCIQPTVTKANSFLKSGTVTVNGVTTAGLNYVGPTGTYTPTVDQATVANALRSALEAYNTEGGPCTNP